MKIFLTGSTGFLGRAIMHYLPEYEFFSYKRGDNIIEDLKKFKPDIIIHSAGEIYKEDKMFDSNVVMTLDILNYVRDNNVEKMIYFGSSSEYGKRVSTMKETDICNPETLYAATKTCGTVLCQAYAKTYDKDICIIRPFSVYGPFEPEHRLIPTLYRKIINGEEVNLIHGNHDFIFIEDFVDIVQLVIKSDKKKTKADIINAGTGKEYSNLAIAKKFSSILGKELRYNLIDKIKECDSQIWISDTRHLEENYEYKPLYDVDKGLEEYKIFVEENIR